MSILAVIRSSEKNDKYQKTFEKNLKWLQYLDSKDSNPNDGKVDIELFNNEVGKFGYKVDTSPNYDGNWHYSTKTAVSIYVQAKSMTEQYLKNIKE